MIVRWMNQSTCYKAAEKGRFKTLKYAIDNGCKYDTGKMLNNIKVSNKKIKMCIEYIKEL